MAKKNSGTRRSKIRYRYNWNPDLPDRRDFLFDAFIAIQKNLPSSVDLRSLCSPIVNQGQIGSCTGNALAGAMEFLELRDLRDLDHDDPDAFDPDQFESLSRLFIYYNERAIEGRTNQDSGASLRDGVKSLFKLGICREKLWAYSQAKLFNRPSTASYREAFKHRIKTYLSLKTLTELRQCLTDGYPFAFGFSVYESFESTQVANSGVMPMPNLSEKLLGGHAVLAVGYDDRKKFLWVRNSWGVEWGQKGYFQMPYAFIEAGLARDFWTIRK